MPKKRVPPVPATVHVAFHFGHSCNYTTSVGPPRGGSSIFAGHRRQQLSVRCLAVPNGRQWRLHPHLVLFSLAKLPREELLNTRKGVFHSSMGPAYIAVIMAV